MKLWLARHARPLVAEGVCYGASDVAADPQATQDAAALLATQLPPGLAVSASPLQRCTQLAEALRALRRDLAFTRDARLAEMDFGRWEGRRWDTIAPADYAAWTADFAAYRCGGGECVADLMDRVAQALAAARAAGTDAVWITHGGVVRAATLLVQGAPVPREAGDWPRAGLEFGQWTCLQVPDFSG